MPRHSLLPVALRRGGARALAFLVLWLVLHGGSPGALAVGVLTAAAAAWLSLMLLPPVGQPLVLGALARLAVRFPAQSVVAGLDVARRALAPALPLRPGIVHCPARIPPGAGRAAFHAYLSLQPGTLPVAMQDEATLRVHALDLEQPVAASVAAAEADFARLQGGCR